ncbi:hypothetical protein EZV62_019129 [Acer yangbiense]|uniref:Uncharacterized protein n=1 Tax=Acer yangbiense TaxID=1000413 RepID=A0A5C7H9M2_9ROSI|nr:hypothetical protein EZV62_019129 [Acer yangbiense]
MMNLGAIYYGCPEVYAVEFFDGIREILCDDIQGKWSINNRRLNGRNYLVWSQPVKTFLKGKGKSSHLEGPIPEKNDPKFSEWDEKDSMIMSWLWNSMQPEIGGTYMFLTTAKDIWEAVKQSYSKVQDAAQIYELKTKISSTKQGSLSVIEYYNLLKSLWLELDHYQNLKMKCGDDIATLREYVECERIFEFLAGLNAEFDQVRVQVLGKEPLPSLNEVFSIIRAKSGRRLVMLENKTGEASTLAAKGVTGLPQMGGGNGAEMGRNSKGVWCNYCKKPHHTKETCWKLHGKPANIGNNTAYGNQQPGRAHMVQSEDENNMLNKEDIEKLKHFLGSLETPIDSDEYIFESLDLESEPNSTIEPVVELVEPEFVNESVSAGNENETTTQPLQVYTRRNKSILPLLPAQASTSLVSPNMEPETKTHIHTHTTNNS